MVAADGAVLAIVDLANSSAPNSQTTSRDHGKVAAISAASARGGRMLNGRGMECRVSRQGQRQSGTTSGGCQMRCKVRHQSGRQMIAIPAGQPPNGAGPAMHPAGCDGEPGAQKFRPMPHLRAAHAITSFG